MFHFKIKQVRPNEKGEYEWMRVTVEMSLDRLDYSRVRYNLLDLLAQFGGFMGIFRWIFTTFMVAWNTNALENFMVSKLYKVKDAEEEVSLERSRWPHCGEYLISWVPSPS